MNRLSIIIPVYNTNEYLNELLTILDRQITSDVEVIVIDDGSDVPVKADYEWLTLIRQKNAGVSAARNKGIDKSRGEYIAFIDSDDLIAENYISTILNKIETEQFDYMYLSWKTFGNGWKCDVRLNNINDKFPSFNLCVWNRIYKRSVIGDIRFNTKKKIAEDAEFIKNIDENGKKKAFISDYMYFYRSDASNSLTKRFAAGEVEFKRIIYNFKRIENDMTYLIDDVKKANEDAEVIIMTQKNAIPELEKYAMVIRPMQIKGTELRGEKTSLFVKIEQPTRAQIVIFTAVTFEIGGIETFIYQFCKEMSKSYDIIVLYDTIAVSQKLRLMEYVDVIKNDGRPIVCDNLILNRITDKAPKNVKFNKLIRMVHACKMVNTWSVPEDADEYICVSDVVKKSFGLDNSKVINNIVMKEKKTPVLTLITATRLSTFEKGEKRMIEFAKKLKEAAIKFIWIIFADKAPSEMVDGMIFAGKTLDVKNYMPLADYLVQLSDAEGFCYSIVEALNEGTAVITTPIDVLSEIGFVDGVHGYTVPFNIADEQNISKILKLPVFDYKYDNDKRIKQWQRILGKTTRKNRSRTMKEILIEITYYDTVYERRFYPGDVIKVTESRAKEIINAGLGKEIVN